ncbi:glycosyltransferase family 4 protein [Janibacter terrae]|uniref:glycosyltransferase family 4 protein n=1 Tax=Janibacter terrae TaxID=103817 RepID=UPI003D15A13E
MSDCRKSPLHTVALMALTSATTTFLVAPLIRRGLLAIGSLDVPNSRSSHQQAVVRGGGLSCVIGMAIATCTTSERPSHFDVAAVATMASVGFLDDLFNVPASLRLASQFLGGTALTLHHSPDLGLTSVLILPALVNAVNFMDGINGITGTTSTIWGINAISLGTGTQSMRSLGALAVGGGIGFLPYNFPDATLFLGDVGSYLFGAIFATASVQRNQSLRGLTRLNAPLLLYVTDTGSCLVQRALRRQPLMAAHREHVYQQLVHRCGLSHTQVTLLHAAAASLVTLFARHKSPWVSLLGAAATSAGYVLSPHLIGSPTRTKQGLIRRASSRLQNLTNFKCEIS